MRRVIGRVVALFAAILLVLGLGSAPAAADPRDFCLAHMQKVLAVAAKIKAHNARSGSVNRRSAASVAAYNASATKLNAEKTKVAKAAQNCLDAIRDLADERTGSPELKKPTAEREKAIETARKALPNTWTPPPRPTSTAQNWPAPSDANGRKLYDSLRSHNPGELGNVTLRGRPRPKVGDTDDAYPGLTIGAKRNGDPRVTPDHIIPLTEIMQMKGFLQLTPRNMFAVTRAPLNYQWLSIKANLSKQSRSVGGMSGVNKKWQDDQIKLADEVRPKLEALIQKLLASQ